ISSLSVAAEKIDIAEHSGLDEGQIKKVRKIRESLHKMKDIIKKDSMDLGHAAKKPTDHIKLFKEISHKYRGSDSKIMLLESTGMTAITEWKKVDHKATMGTKKPGAPAATTTKEPERIKWLLNTVPGTSMEHFEAFIGKLPDKGAGKRITFPSLRYQHYVGKMTQNEAHVVSKHSIIDQIVLAYGKVEHSGVLQRIKPRTWPQYDVEFQDGTPHIRHLLMISQHQTLALKDIIETGPSKDDYTFDGSAGRGINIYIIDSGFNVNHQEFVDRDGSAKFSHYIPPKLLSSTGHPITDIKDDGAHGTCVAACAAGKYTGVAKLANLIGVKTWSRPEQGKIDRSVFVEAWRWIIHDVKSKGLAGKAVINMSFTPHNPLGFSVEFAQTFEANRNVPDIDYHKWKLPRPFHMDFFLPLLQEAWENDIVTVVACGNNRHKVRGQFSPQRYGRINNPLITVSSVDGYGVPSIENTPVGASMNTNDESCKGSDDISAKGVDMLCAHFEHNDKYSKWSGSSLAAPQVAGLAAYYLALPSTDLPKGNVAMQVKDALLRQKRSEHLGSPDGHGCATNWEEEIFCGTPQRSNRFAVNEGNETTYAASTNRSTARVSGRADGIKLQETSFHSVYRDGRWNLPERRKKVSNP
ncbi:MAG: hypothetical protein Q9164_007339, partial [Protoblastenia rupestris]